MLVLHNGHTVVETVYVRGPNLQVLVDPVLAPIGAVVVNARSALTWATILVKRGGKQYSTPHLAGRDMPHAVGRRGGEGGHDTTRTYVGMITQAIIIIDPWALRPSPPFDKGGDKTAG